MLVTIKIIYHKNSHRLKSTSVCIFGECHGVRLRKRSPKNNDYHILVDIICEDDGQWFETNTLGSSHWIPDFENVLKTLNKYFKECCEPDGKYGFKFKE